jgi:hypothetical protein
MFDAMKRTAAATHAWEWHLLTRDIVKARSHHDEIAAVSTAVPALSKLVPFAVALWIRVKRTGRLPAQPMRQRCAGRAPLRLL